MKERVEYGPAGWLFTVIGVIPAKEASAEARSAVANPSPSMSGAVEAARRIVAAQESLEKAKQETHPSFKDAINALAYHEVHASAREGALILARAFLKQHEALQKIREPITVAGTLDVVTACQDLHELIVDIVDQVLEHNGAELTLTNSAPETKKEKT